VTFRRSPGSGPSRRGVRLAQLACLVVYTPVLSDGSAPACRRHLEDQVAGLESADGRARYRVRLRRERRGRPVRRAIVLTASAAARLEQRSFVTQASATPRAPATPPGRPLHPPPLDRWPRPGRAPPRAPGRGRPPRRSTDPPRCPPPAKRVHAPAPSRTFLHRKLAKPRLRAASCTFVSNLKSSSTDGVRVRVPEGPLQQEPAGPGACGPRHGRALRGRDPAVWRVVATKPLAERQTGMPTSSPTTHHPATRALPDIAGSRIPLRRRPSRRAAGSPRPRPL
jgi:hypothetical protein